LNGDEKIMKEEIGKTKLEIPWKEHFKFWISGAIVFLILSLIIIGISAYLGYKCPFK
jgi:hypothetical protein